MKNLFLLIILSLFFSCASKKNTTILNYATPLPPGTTVEVIGNGQKVPDGARLLGHVKVGESGMTATKNCTYDKVMEASQAQARSMGGNLIQIIQHKEPNFASSCHRLKVDVYLKNPKTKN